MKNKYLSKGLIASVLALTSIGGFALSKNVNIHQEVAYATYTNGDAATYYTGIGSKTGDDLLSALRSLNSSKRKSTVGYSAMGTSPSGQFKYTDYDPNYVQYDNNGQPYGTKITSFYSGNSTTSFNREHVWPNSHGGNVIENDIHMPRPTIASENGSRGNSFYVEGKKSSTAGWDPAMEDFGKESYRGDSARIIFYCMLVDSRLQLIEADSHSTSNNNKDYMMGRLSHLLKWNIDYPVEQREKNRNEGAEYLQGNRNPFIDHPEYACKIWGNTNDETKAICANDTSGGVNPTKITLNTNSVSLFEGQSEQLSIASVTPEGANDSVTWSTSNASVATVSGTGLITAVKAGYANITATSSLDANIKAVCQVYVSEPQPVDVSSISLSFNNEITVGGTSNIAITNNPSYVYPAPTYQYTSDDTSIATVSNSGVIKGVSAGTATITVDAYQGGVKKATASGVVTVSESAVITSNTYEKVTSNLSDWTGNYLIGYEKNGSATLWDSSSSSDNSLIKDVAISDNKINLESESYFTIEKYNDGYSIKNCDGKYISGTSGSNTVNYDSSASNCSISYGNSTGTLITSNTSVLRYNTGANMFRFYKSSSYSSQGIITLFKAVNGSTPVTPSISLNKTSATLEVGDTLTLTATTKNGSGAVSWSSSNTNVATVSNNGLVSAVNEGTATITASYSGVTAKCVITVNKAVVIEPTLTISISNVSLDIGETRTITATAKNGTGNVTWASSDATIASVFSTTGTSVVITGLKEGTATITASYSGLTTTCSVTVNKPQVVVEPTLTISINNQTINVGDSFNLTANGENGSGNITWTTSDNSIASISVSTGSSITITGLKEGTATITASYSGLTASCVVIVNKIEDGGHSEETISNGCGGSIVATSSLLFVSSLLGISLLIKRRKQK